MVGRYNRDHGQFHRWYLVVPSQWVSVRCLGGSTAQTHGNLRPVLLVDAERYYRCLPGTESIASNHRSVPDERYNRSPERFYRGVSTGLYILNGAEGFSFSLLPRSSSLCPSRRPSLPLPQSASRTSDPWALRGFSPWKPPDLFPWMVVMPRVLCS